MLFLGIREFKGAVQLTLDNISDLSSHRSMLKRAELVLKYLMKSIDVMKQMQDSEQFPSVSETLRNTVIAAPSILAFPENISGLPYDVSNTKIQSTLPFSQSRSRIGRTPRRKIQRSQDQQETAGNLAEVTRFVDTTQPWRTRCTSVAAQEDPLLEDSVSESLPPVEETFDLTSTVYGLSFLVDSGCLIDLFLV